MGAGSDACSGFQHDWDTEGENTLCARQEVLEALCLEMQECGSVTMLGGQKGYLNMAGCEPADPTMAGQIEYPTPEPNGTAAPPGPEWLVRSMELFGRYHGRYPFVVRKE